MRAATMLSILKGTEISSIYAFPKKSQNTVIITVVCLHTQALWIHSTYNSYYVSTRDRSLPKRVSLA